MLSQQHVFELYLWFSRISYCSIQPKHLGNKKKNKLKIISGITLFHLQFSSNRMPATYFFILNDNISFFVYLHCYLVLPDIQLPDTQLLF